MINFACTCGERFSFPEELAGSSTQCPACRRLVDVPTLSDIEGLADDGTIKFDESRTVERPELDLALIPTRSDDDEVDRRPTFDDLLDAGTEEIPLADEPAKPAPPKYDPETGELIRPMEFKPDEVLDTPADAIPVAQAAPVSYAAGDLDKTVSPATALLELFMPANVLVLFIIMCTHVVMQVMLIPAFGFTPLLWLIFPGVLAIAIAILSHYSNIVEETGFNAKDEIPAPLRGMSLSDDLWLPFSHFAGAFMICFLPAILVTVRLWNTPQALFLGPLLSLPGFFFFPAVWLTLCTAGSVNNLRPDRVLGVIRAGFFAYCALAALGSVVFLLYVNALTMLSLNTVVFLVGVKQLHVPPAVGWPVLFTAIYLAHWFAWCLGLYYRANYERFPWVLQRHIPDPTKQRVPLNRRKPTRTPPRRPPGVAGIPQPPRAQAAQSNPTSKSPTRPVPVQPIPTQPVPVQPVPVQPLPSTSTAARQPVRVQPLPAQPIPLDDLPTVHPVNQPPSRR